MQQHDKIHAPMACTVALVMVVPGQAVQAGQTLLVLEAMKMEHEIRAAADSTVLAVLARAGELVAEGDLLLQLGAAERVLRAEAAPLAAALDTAPTPLRADLQEVFDRHALTLDAARPEAVAKRHALGLRTARENVDDLVDAGSFIEYGALAYAAQLSRRTLEDLVKNTPADGLITGIGSVNAALFGAEASRCVVMAYDATVLAGTQGQRNHAKTDRLLGVAVAAGPATPTAARSRACTCPASRATRA
jgi:pyruvate/2-oxoglutarate dehydrogenase complex dihydrolipoamide acyltransferase (E2) component